MSVLTPGQMLGPYQVIEQIGMGGMATVYKAYHAAMDRYVALKVVAAQLSEEPNFLQRFRQEARLIARLEHPHILPVYDFGEADGVPYMVMRFLDAGTLKERLAAGPLNMEETDRIFTQLAGALAYAHEKGIIHRDIKPSNAMLDRRGDAFLTDFGVAKIVEATTHLTATGAVTGTPAYMSPEQAQGIKADQRSDIYSMGVLLFEMLTGRVPFEAETPMAVLFKQIQDPPPPLSSVRPELPRPLEAVLLKALAKNPADRYQTMDAFLERWKQALAESPIPAPAADRTPPILPAARPVSPTPAPLPAKPPTGTIPAAKKSSPLKWILPAAGGLACLALLCVSAVLLRGRILPAAKATRTARAETPLPATEAATGTETASGAGEFSSWSAANTVYAIGFRGDEVLAGGHGGITIWSPDGSHTQMTTADGLPSAYVTDLLVEGEDSLWVATDAGLVHFHGEESDYFDSSNGLDSDDVIAIARVGDRLFAGTRYSGEAGGGLLEYDGETWQAVADFPSEEEPGGESVSYNVNDIIGDPDGNLWVVTGHGIAMLDGDRDWNVFTTQNGLPDDNVYCILADSDGQIWAGTSDGGVARFDWDAWNFRQFTSLNDRDIYSVYTILQDEDGALWFGGGNVARYDPATKDWATFTKDDGSLPSSAVISGGMAADGSLYFGTDEAGLIRYDGDSFTQAVVPNVPSFAQPATILPAPDGKLLFLQLYDYGADEFDPASGEWSTYPVDQGVPRIFDTRGQMWGGGWEGLWIVGPGKTTHITTHLGLPSDQVNGIAFGPDGIAYIATDAGLAVFDGKKVTRVYTQADDGLASDNVYSLFTASDGSLWVSVDGGFSHLLPDGEWEHFTAEKLFSGYASYFPAFAEDASGAIWVTTHGDGVYRLAAGKWERMRSADPGVGLPSDYVNSVAVAPDGSIWFGTYGDGAVRYDGETWQKYGVEDGLIDAVIYDVYVADDGTVWFATNGGVTRLKP
jgi:serine/threonine-protein kinase